MGGGGGGREVAWERGVEVYFLFSCYFHEGRFHGREEVLPEEVFVSLFLSDEARWGWEGSFCET